MATIPDSLPRPTPTKAAQFHWSWLIYGLLLALILLVFAFTIFQPITVLPRITLAPGYALESETGHLMTSEDARGQLTLYSFTYTNCEENCPVPGAALSELHQQITQHGPTNVPVALITISLDPERDTAVARQTYLDQYQQPNSHVPWHFAATDEMRTRVIVGSGFELYYRTRPDTDGDGYQIAYDPHFILVDGMGIMRAEYRLTLPDPEIILRDLHLIAEEVEKSQGAGRLAYEAAHLFMCYPR